MRKQAKMQLSQVETYIADPPRREVKNATKERKAGKRARLRESHRNMSLEGIERRINGNKLGHRRRIQMFNEQMQAW